MWGQPEGSRLTHPGGFAVRSDGLPAFRPQTSPEMRGRQLSLCILFDLGTSIKEALRPAGWRLISRHGNLPESCVPRRLRLCLPGSSAGKALSTVFLRIRRRLWCVCSALEVSMSHCSCPGPELALGTACASALCGILRTCTVSVSLVSPLRNLRLLLSQSAAAVST